MHSCKSFIGGVQTDAQQFVASRQRRPTISAVSQSYEIVEWRAPSLSPPERLDEFIDLLHDK